MSGQNSTKQYREQRCQYRKKLTVATSNFGVFSNTDNRLPTQIQEKSWKPLQIATTTTTDSDKHLVKLQLAKDRGAQTKHLQRNANSFNETEDDEMYFQRVKKITIKGLPIQ